MNRKVEFRGKRVDTGEWVYGDIYRNYDDQLCGIRDCCGHNPVIPKTVGQYTGLKDKNGVKMFEGDIVRHMSIGRKSTYIVAWDVGSGAFHYKPTKGTGGHRMFVNGSGFAPYEIVGTTHDNPELLEVLGE